MMLSILVERESKVIEDALWVIYGILIHTSAAYHPCSPRNRRLKHSARATRAFFPHKNGL